MMLILLTRITIVAGILPFTRYVSAHIPFPCDRLSRLEVLLMCPTASTPSALLVVACQAYRKNKQTPGCMGSLLFLTTLSLHATPGHPGGFKKPHYIIAETVS
jgi:hypothetical protein